MMVSELLTEQRIAELRRGDPARMALVQQALAERRVGLRQRLAASLVRVGVWLDRNASERAMAPAREIN